MSAANLSRSWADFEFEDHQWLVSSAGRKVLLDWSQEDWTRAANLQRLQREVGAVRSRLVASQLALRERGKTKFPGVENLFLTPTALEQASSKRLADYKANRLAAVNSVSGGAIYDLCCGIGGDAISLATTPKAAVSRELVAIDADPVCALYATANLESYANVSVRNEAVGLDYPDFRDAVVHIDPDRRQADQRSIHIEQFSPDVSVLSAILDQTAAAAIKLAPGSELPEDWLERVTPEWLGENRECKQLMVWSGELAEPLGKHRATAWTSKGWETLLLEPQPLPLAAFHQDRLDAGTFLFEPHACVLAGELAGAMCAEHQLQPLTPEGGYLVGAEFLELPLLQAYEIVQTVKPKLPAVEKALQSLGSGSVEVKKRGVKLDPNQWQKKLNAKRSGDDPRWVVVIYGVENKQQSLICRRV